MLAIRLASAAAALRSLTAFQGRLLGALSRHTNTACCAASYTCIKAGRGIYTAGPASVGILVGQRRRGRRVTHFCF